MLNFKFGQLRDWSELESCSIGELVRIGVLQYVSLGHMYIFTGLLVNIRIPFFGESLK